MQQDDEYTGKRQKTYAANLIIRILTSPSIIIMRIMGKNLMPTHVLPVRIRGVDWIGRPVPNCSFAVMMRILRLTPSIDISISIIENRPSREDR